MICMMQQLYPREACPGPFDSISCKPPAVPQNSPVPKHVTLESAGFTKPQDWRRAATWLADIRRNLRSSQVSGLMDTRTKSDICRSDNKRIRFHRSLKLSSRRVLNCGFWQTTPCHAHRGGQRPDPLLPRSGTDRAYCNTSDHLQRMLNRRPGERLGRPIVGG
jgi:hypothetical protein